jgi:pimeloyl-ACP methyl ester carboxylesterase
VTAADIYVIPGARIRNATEASIIRRRYRGTFELEVHSPPEVLMHYTTLSLLAGTLLAATACTDRSSPVGVSPDAAVRTAKVTTPGSGPWARIVEGETGPGSLYALYIPPADKWNGEAIYYAHGIRPPLDDITLNDQDNFFQVRDELGALGYAFAYSSFSENGLAVKDGAQRTHQLRGLLNSELDSLPKRNYLVGYSLGALSALELAERFPGQYDGVLAMCGMVGGTPLELQYVGDVRALFDAYFPGALPGSPISAPVPMTLAEIQAAVVGAISANALGPVKMFAIASTAQTPLAYIPDWTPTVPRTGIETSMAFKTMVQSLVVALYYQNIGTPDVLGRTHGHSPYDNQPREYTMGTPAVPSASLIPLIQSMIAGSNTTVTRYDITPDAQNYLERNYVPTGNLRIPVVSVHNSWDYLVPLFHEPQFEGIVARAGASNMLLQRTVQNYGHCNFETPVVVGSFQTLANWVSSGRKPAS